MLVSIHPTTHPMALWPPNFSILCCQLPVGTPATSGSTFFYTFFPFTVRSPHWSTASKLSFHSFNGYTVERESLNMSSPLHSLNRYMYVERQIWEFSLLELLRIISLNFLTTARSVFMSLLTAEHQARLSPYLIL